MQKHTPDTQAVSDLFARVTGTTLQRQYAQAWINTYGKEKVLVALERARGQEVKNKDTFETAYLKGQVVEIPPPVEIREPPRSFTPVPSKLSPTGFCGDPILAEMPPLIQCLAESRMEGTSICPDFATAGALATVAACVGNRLCYEAWGNHYLPNEYIILVAETGTSLKSSVLHRAQEIMSDVDPACLLSGGTPEGVLAFLEEKSSCFWIKDELRGILAALKVGNYMVGTQEVLVELFEHWGVHRKRLSKKMHTSVNPALTFLTTIQPEIMGQEFINDPNINSGLINRFLIVEGMRVEAWPRLANGGSLRHMLNDELRLLSHQPLITISAQNLEEEASEWAAEQERDLGREYGPVVARRAANHALKLAALMQAASKWPAGMSISREWLYASMGLLTRWFKRAAVLIEAVHLKKPGELDRRQVWRYICEHSHNGSRRLDWRDVMKMAQIGKREQERLQEDLEGRGWVHVDEMGKPFCVRCENTRGVL